ncbi:MAG: hypothetical protein DI585_04675 [Pseudomonas fluorescens]|nr:MAG: hypothetical protein DI585_04675 [Pseudomonas fluorescens]
MYTSSSIKKANRGVYCYIILLSILAMFFGGNFPLAQSLIPLGAAIFCGTTLFFSPHLKKIDNTKPILAIFLPAVMVLAWSLLQITPLPTGLALESPFWSLTPSPSQWSTLSINPLQTLAYLPYALALGLIGWSLYLTGTHSPLAIIKGVAILISITSLYGIITFALGNAYVMWLPKTSYPLALSASFINPGSFATFAGLAILANLALLLQRVGEVSSRLSPSQRLKAFWFLVIHPGWPWALLILVNFTALVLTGSLTALISTLTGIIVMVGFLAAMRPPARWPLVGLAAGILLMATTLFLLLGGYVTQQILENLDTATLQQTIYYAGQNLISQFGITGTGLGTFQSSLSIARTPDLFGNIPYVIEHANNTYLELLIELGIPAVALLGISLLGLATVYAKGLTTRKTGIIWPALGISTLTFVATNALTDLSLSIPAVAIAALGILMTCLAQSAPESKTQQTPTPRTALHKVAFTTALVAVGMWSAWTSMANYYALKAEPTLRDITTQQPLGPGPMFIAQNRLTKCLAINSFHPTCRQDLAEVNLALANGYGLTGAQAGVGLVYLNTAHAHYLSALQDSPVNAQNWYRVAQIEAFLGNKLAATKAMANSIMIAPSEPGLAQQRIVFMLSYMNDTNEDNSSLFADNILLHWEMNPALVASELQNYPEILPTFASLLPSTHQTYTLWKRYIKTPFPKLTPLGDSDKKE